QYNNQYTRQHKIQVVTTSDILPYHGRFERFVLSAAILAGTPCFICVSICTPALSVIAQTFTAMAAVFEVRVLEPSTKMVTSGTRFCWTPAAKPFGICTITVASCSIAISFESNSDGSIRTTLMLSLSFIMSTKVALIGLLSSSTTIIGISVTFPC